MKRRDWTPTRSRDRASGFAGPSACLLAWVVLLFSPASAMAAGGLELTPDPSIVISLLIFFVVLIYPLNSMIVRPIFKVLDERTERIEGQQGHADQLVADAEEVMSRYRESIRDARQSSEVERQHFIGEARSEQTAITSDAKGEADTEIARAREEISASVEEARRELESATQDLAKVAAGRILGRELS